MAQSPASNTSAVDEPAVEARVSPVGKAVMLLGVGAPELAGRKYTIDGRRVQLLRFGRISLAVAYGDRAEYSPAAVTERRRDAHWLSIEARVHEHAVDRASAIAPIVPARLLTTFDDLDKLAAMARTHYARWSRNLARLGPKREYVVRAFRGPHLLRPAELPYLLRTSAHAVRAARAPVYESDSAIAAELGAWWSASARVALGTRRLDAPAPRGEVFAGVLLASATAGEALAKIANERASAFGLGLSYYVEGPRLPFSFV